MTAPGPRRLVQMHDRASACNGALDRVPIMDMKVQGSRNGKALGKGELP